MVRTPRSNLLLSLLIALAVAADVEAQQDAPDKPTREDAAVVSDPSLELQSPNRDSPVSLRRRVLIVVGLPGDQEREARFSKIVTDWKQWLMQIGKVSADDITVLRGAAPTEDSQPATQENLRLVIDRLVSQSGANDSLWVFLLGHGSEDKRDSWFHLPGADLNAQQWAGMFAELKSGEQVFWLTHSASGRFLKPFSLLGRVVITATDEGEVNETRFPDSLAEVMTKQLQSNNRDSESGASSQTDNLLGLFLLASGRVTAGYDEDNLVPTEHARLDDNGDGIGSESIDLATSAPLELASGAAGTVIDGLNAAAITLMPLNPDPFNAPLDPNDTQRP